MAATDTDADEERVPAEFGRGSSQVRLGRSFLSEAGFPSGNKIWWQAKDSCRPSWG